MGDMRIFMVAIAVLAMLEGALELLPRPVPLSFPSGSDATATAKIDAFRSSVVDQLSSAPLRSDLWLLLAMSDHDLPKPDEEAQALEMAYLTGGEKAEDIPARLRLAVGSAAFASKTIQDFVRTDIELILHRAPALRPALISAYRGASPQNRPRYEALVRDADPDFVTSLLNTK